jgi:prepilin-type N-terminal cleavage/methylation domain-containing protein/prepilin-type processing-associated H-X9-DG protein
MNKKAFTLIELLVVISIIALLMAIMMPALQKARNIAKKTICMSNVKNLTYATMLYLEDNEHRFPTRHPGADLRYNTKDDSYWDDKLYQYLEEFEVFLCPITSSRFKEYIKMLATDKRGVEKWKHAETYRFNAWLSGWPGFNNDSRPWPETHTSNEIPLSLSVGNVKYTADTAMIVDGSGVADNMNGLRRFSYFYNGGIRFMPDIMPAHEIQLKNNGKTIPFHNVPECTGGVSIGFADGHCESIAKFEYTNEVVNEKTPPRGGLKVNPTGSEL